MRRPLWWRIARVVVVVIVALLAVMGMGLATMDRWLFEVLDPGPFDASATPTAPDYAAPESWAALPETSDGADVSLPELSAVAPGDAPADVFYVHPTTWVGEAWNAPLSDPAIAEATERGGTLIQASVFNGCCAVYAPRYRQANGRAFVQPSEQGHRAIDLAYADIAAAFEVFLKRQSPRPYIVAAHSQGAVLAARLLRERIAGTKLQQRLVAAYLPGGPIRAETVGGVPSCDTPSQIGCVAAWNARGPSFVPNGFEYDAANPATMEGRLCVNPISWRTDGAHALAEHNAGAVFFDTPAPILKPAFADAQCVDGTLLVTVMGDPERDMMSKLLLWTMGPDNYHPIEYQLFYASLRRNAAERVAAFREATHSGE